MGLRQQDFEMYQDEAKQIAFDCTQEDGATALDLSAMTLVWKMGPDPSAATLTKSGAAITVSDAPGSASGANDRATVALDAGDTTATAPGIYYHELRDEAAELVLAAGHVNLLESVSK